MVVLKLKQVRTLPSVAATHAYVPNMSRFDYIMQSLHRLLNWSIRIEAVALQDVDIIKLKAFQWLFHRIENVLQMQSVINHGHGGRRRIWKHPHLATETMLVHVSYLVELGGWCHVHSLFHRFTDSRVQLYDVLGSI
jgi:hypothetical protein